MINRTLLCILLLCCLAACRNSPVQKDIPANYTDSSKAAADDEFHEANYKKAAELYAKFADKNSSSETLFNYAESLRISGNIAKAKDYYDMAIAKESGMLAAIEGKSLCYIQEGKFKEAQNLLEEVVSRDASRWRSINALGVVYAMNGNLNKALEYYNIALDVSKNNPAVLNNMALSLTFSGDKERGKKLLEKTLSNLDLAKDKKQKIEYNLALIYGISGDMDKAKSILAKYLPEAEVYNNLGVYAKMAKNDDLAKEYLSKALSSSPVYYDKAGKNLETIAR